MHMYQFSSVQLHSCVRLFATHESQHARPPGPSPTPGVHSDSHPLSHDAIQPSHPLSSSSPPAPHPSQHQGLFQWVSSSHEVAKVPKFQLQHQSFQFYIYTIYKLIINSMCISALLYFIDLILFLSCQSSWIKAVAFPGCHFNFCSAFLNGWF